MLEECTGYGHCKCKEHKGDGHYKGEEWKGTTITYERNIQGTESSLQDGDHIDGYFITLFAEQLTRTFEVLVKIIPGIFTRYISKGERKSNNFIFDIYVHTHLEMNKSVYCFGLELKQ